MENQELIDRVFSNTLILQLILSYNQDDIVISYFEKRLVNKTFNNAWLAVIRKEYRDMHLEYANVPNDAILQFFFNHRKINKRIILNFLDFLKNVADVKVEELSIRNGLEALDNLNLSFMDEVLQLTEGYRRTDTKKALHDGIHALLIEKPRKLIGMEDLCGGCADCLEMAKSTKEYGPVGIESLMKLGETQHSRSLIINERFLEQLANRSVLSHATRSECLLRLDDLINPQISVETLVLWITETRSQEGRVFKRNHFPFPVEVLEMIIKKWGVKSIRIVFQHGFRFDIVDDKWSTVFTKFRFTDSEFERAKGIEMKHVEIDMSESFICHREFQSFNSESWEQKGFVNLIANTRKLFFTNSILISKFFVSQLISEVFSNILEMVRKGKQPNLTIKMQYFIAIDSFDALKSASLSSRCIGKDYVMPVKGSNTLCTYCRPIRKTDNVYYFPMKKWIGKRFKVEDEKEGFQFNLDTFISDSALFHGYPEEKLDSDIKQFREMFL